MHLQAQIEENTKATGNANNEALELLDKLDAVRMIHSKNIYVLTCSLSTRFMTSGRSSPQTTWKSGQFNQQSP